jgi:hypothetical protein
MEERKVREEEKTYVKENKSLGPVDRIPLEVFGSSLQHLLIDTSHHLSNTKYQLVRGRERGSLQ